MRESLRRRASLSDRLARIRETLDAFGRHPESLTEGASLLLSSVLQFVELFENALDQRWDLFDEYEAKTGKDYERQRIALCADYQDILTEVGTQLVPVLGGSNPSDLPFEIEPIVQYVVEKAVGHTRTAVLYSSFHYNYSVRDYRELTSSLATKLKFDLKIEEIDQSFVLFSVPRLEKDSAALHAMVLGHECGHVRDWRQKITYRVEEEIPTAYIGPDHFVVKDLLTQEYGAFARVAHSWVREVVADIYAAFLIGPAALFCLSELTSNLRSFTADSDSHPASDRRLKVMLTVLESTGFGGVADVSDLWKPIADDVKDSLDRSVRITTKRRVAIGADAAQAAWEWVKGMIDDLVEACRASLSPDEIFAYDRWDKDVLPAAKRLGSGLPHGEYRSAANEILSASERVILNAAWFVRLSRLDSLREELGLDNSIASITKARLVLDQLVLKSFEVARFRKLNAFKG